MKTFIDDTLESGKDNSGDWRKTMVVMAIGAFIVMCAGTYWDVSVTSALIHSRLPGFNAFMGRTVFEGDLPGANDVVSLFLIAATAIYIYSIIKEDGRIRSWRPHAGFVITSGLLIGLFMVHGLKFLVGRARPSLVMNEAWPYSLWFAFGPHDIAEGTFNASFPSGHTAQAFVLMTVAYLLSCDPLASGRMKRIGWLCGAIALLYSAAMGVARCASQNHWLTDVLGSICLGWLFMHWIYFGLLQVPAQQCYRSAFGHQAALPRAWELSLSIAIFLMGAGVVVTVNSLRIILGNGGSPWFGGLIALGAAFGWTGWRLFRRYRRAVKKALGSLG